MKAVEFYIHKELIPDENCISLTQAYQEGRMSLKRIIEEWGIHLLSNGTFAATIVLALAFAPIFRGAHHISAVGTASFPCEQTDGAYIERLGSFLHHLL